MQEFVKNVGVKRVCAAPLAVVMCDGLSAAVHVAM